MEQLTRVRMTAGAALVALALLAGCKSEQQKAMDQAKAQAASTNTPQQIQYIDKNGDTVTTTVQPPTQGQPQQVATTIAPPPPGPPPHRTKPVITPLGAASGAPAPNEAEAQAPSQPAPANGAAGQPAGSPPPPLNLTVPAGTELAVRVNQRISVKHAVAGEHFSGEIVEPVEQNGAVLIPRGTPVEGRIDRAHRRGHFKGRSYLELRLVSMTMNGYSYGLDTRDTVRSKRGKGRRTGGFIGGMTGAGMLIGGIASGGVGLAIGGASGAGAGTLLAGATGNRDIVIPAESIVHFRLADQLVVQNP
jgi:outer membrane murein-binding lipoprotein Lpp